MSQYSEKRLKILNNININNVTIIDRIKFIKYLLYHTDIVPLISNDIDINSTESFQSKFIKNTYDFSNVIKQIGGKISYIKSGSGGHVFKGIIQPYNNESFIINYAIKVVPYHKEYTDVNKKIPEAFKNIHNIERPENTEIYILRLLSQFVLSEQTPHIILPITTFNTSIEPFIKVYHDLYKVSDENKHDNRTKELKEKFKRYEKFVIEYEKKKLYHDTVSIIMSEWANGGDLLTYIKNKIKNKSNISVKEWKVILFQVFSVFAVIQKKYPSFRHNDAKANNFLIQNLDIEDNLYFKYTLEDKEFIIPNIGYRIKLWDFDFASIKDIAENAKVNLQWANDMNISSDQNRYYDICYFLSSIQHPNFLDGFRENVPSEVLNFIDDIVPSILKDNNFLDSKRGRLLVNLEYVTPIEVLLYHPFFNKFKDKHDRINTPFVASGLEELKILIKNSES